MRTTNRVISIFSALSLAVVGLAACGGSSGSDEVVARVAGVTSISKATLDHWLPVEATVVYQEYPTTPVPKGLVPDPPDYSDCISYLGAKPPSATSEAKPTVAQLKGKCAQRYQELKVLSLNTLIVWHWTIAAGMALGMTVSDAEAKARLKETNPRYFSTNAQFTRYLKLTGQTVSDMVFRSRVQVFEDKMLAKFEAQVKSLPKTLTEKQRQSALANLTKALPPNKAWAEKTTCSSELVVSACKQYKGPEAPGIPN